MLEIILTDRVKNEVVLRVAKEERNIPYRVKKGGRLTGLVRSCLGIAF
jgi:hypothetical protein